MPLTLPAPCPLLQRVRLNRLPPRRGHYFSLPRRRPTAQRASGVCMAEMAMVGSGSSGRDPEESDAILGVGGGDAPRRQATGWAVFEATLNRMSKWLVAGCFALAAIWKHDPEIMWAMMGSVVNTLLSSALKRVFNHERPAPAQRSDPGMPSSHAQSIFYAAVILFLSLFNSLGESYLSIIFGVATLATACYLSWLRVSQRLHTLNQVLVGGIVGSSFGALWFVLWHSLVREAFVSLLWVKIIVTLGSAVFCFAFAFYMIRYWLKDE